MYEPEAGVQLSLEVGGDEPETSSFRIAGTLTVKRELRMGALVAVHLIDADGEVVAEGDGLVNLVQFQHRQTTDHEWVERIHGVKLG
jgi:hypothetical protein